ncbi:MAG TPA: superoxide dismutase [Nevskiaceae bacterium]|nr:superoxide dismutase [Nevskiaceae bacterium]
MNIATDHVYKLPELPYPMEALEPAISRKTLLYHHDRHHRAYVTKLNELVVGTPFHGTPLEEIVRTAQGALFNNAAQAYNHAFYWNCLTPRQGLAPSDGLRAAIKNSFGSPEHFIDQFRTSALAKFGSGWTWLVIKPDGSLAIENTNDADTPLRHGRTPLLTCDVWEHAYYLDYQNERRRYVDAFLKVLNWAFVSQNFDAAHSKEKEDA